jgi:hypothetical protein
VPQPDNNLNPMSTFQIPNQQQFSVPGVGNHTNQFHIQQQMQTGANWNVGDEDYQMQMVLLEAA